MIKKYIYSFFLFTLFFCKKEQSVKKTSIDAQVFFSRITDINKLTKTKRTKLNDSTYRITGIIDSLKVTGYLTQNNEKIDWWKIVDKNNNREIVTIEYRLVDNKEFANQYKVFNSSELDVSKSKYYNFLFRKNEEDKNTTYSFYVPKSKYIIKSKGTFLYSVYDINTKDEIVSSKCVCVNSYNIFQCTFSIPKKNNIVISGIFWELSQIKNGEMGGSEIYVRDTIR